MPAFLLSAGAMAIIQKLMLFATLSLLLLILPGLLSFIPGISLTEGSLSWDILSPMTNILASAPPTFRWLVWYFHVDTASLCMLRRCFMAFSKMLSSQLLDRLRPKRSGCEPLRATYRLRPLPITPGAFK